MAYLKKPGLRAAALLLSFLLCAACITTAAARSAYVFEDEAAAILEKLGIFEGTGDGYALDKVISREESAALLVRLCGMREAAGEGRYKCGFADVTDWAEGYVGAAAALSIVNGLPDGSFGGSNPTSARDFCAMLLRVLGYGGRFDWKDSVDAAIRLGLTKDTFESGVFLRGDAASLIYAALICDTYGGPKLVETLYESGAISREALLGTRFAGYANYGKKTYTAAEIYQRCRSAVFSVTMYSSKKDRDNGLASGTGSGFFISPDGIAVLCYHEIDGALYAVAKTSQGHELEIEEVLYYDPYSDICIVRVSAEDSSGRAVRVFPYLTAGDSDALSSGDTVFTLGDPLALTGSISRGVVGEPNRIYDDPDYPVIQFTADISSGSSGGPLINEYGEVIGICMAYFPMGNGLYLAVPSNDMKDRTYFDTSLTVAEVRSLEEDKKAAASISFSVSSITLKKDETACVVCTTDYPGTASLSYWIDDQLAVSCRWGSFTTKQTIPLYITGLKPGTTTVRVRFTEGYGNTEAQAILNVTVTP